MRTIFDDHYRPTGEGILFESKVSVACGVIGFIIYGLLILISYKQAGKAGPLVGLVSWGLLFDAVYGIIYAVAALKQPGGKIIVKTIGLMINSLLLALMLTIFLKGIFL